VQICFPRNCQWDIIKARSKLHATSRSGEETVCAFVKRSRAVLRKKKRLPSTPPPQHGDASSCVSFPSQSYWSFLSRT